MQRQFKKKTSIRNWLSGRVFVDHEPRIYPRIWITRRIWWLAICVSIALIAFLIYESYSLIFPSTPKIQQLEAEIETLQKENEQLTSQLIEQENYIKINHLAYIELLKKLDASQKQEVRLRQEVGFFQTVYSKAEAWIGYFQVDKTIRKNEYQYQAMFSIPENLRVRTPKQFNYELMVNYKIKSGEIKPLLVPEKNQIPTAFKLSPKEKKIIEGFFKIPEGGELQGVEIRLYEGNNVVAIEKIDESIATAD